MSTRFDDGSDAELLAAAQRGDRAALGALIARHEAQVYRFGAKMCRDPADAQDVLQDTLLAMARGVRDFRGASSISTWLYSVARSFCIKKRRRSKFLREETTLDAADEGSSAMSDPARPPDEQLAGKQVELALDAAIRTLAPAYREVLVLRDVEGLTAAEVAEVLGITAQAVKSRLHRARLAVRAAVAPLLGVDDAEAPAAPGGCPDVLTLYSQHREDEVSPELCREMEAHLAGCARCRGACASLQRSLALCRTTAASVKVPPSVQSAVRRAIEDLLREQR